MVANRFTRIFNLFKPVSMKKPSIQSIGLAIVASLCFFACTPPDNSVFKLSTDSASLNYSYDGASFNAGTPISINFTTSHEWTFIFSSGSAFINLSTPNPGAAGNHELKLSLTSAFVDQLKINPDIFTSTGSGLLVGTLVITSISGEESLSINIYNNQKLIKVTLNYNGGSTATSTKYYSSNSSGSYTYKFPSSNPTYSGHTFVGWGGAATGLEATLPHKAAASVTLSESKNFYARWNLVTPTSSSPGFIYFPEQMTGLASTGYYILGSNITLQGNWTPIANFAGSFDGNNRSITYNINSIGSGTTNYAGLFGNLKGVVKNLTVKGSITLSTPMVNNVSIPLCIGGLAATSELNIINVKSEVQIAVTCNTTSSITMRVGGIIGNASASINIQNSSSSGAITVTNTSGISNIYAGGILGYGATGYTVNFSNVSTTGNIDVKASEKAWAGGIVGYFTGGITNAVATGAIKATTTVHVTTDFAHAYAAGIAAQALGSSNSIKNTLAKGNITAIANYSGGRAYAGGIAGFFSIDNITNGVALCAQITATGQQVSYCRRIAVVRTSDTSNKILNCYANANMRLNGSTATGAPGATSLDGQSFTPPLSNWMTAWGTDAPWFTPFL